MKLALFNDFRLGVLKADTVVDVTRAIEDLTNTPQHLISRVIQEFPRLRPQLEEAAAEGKEIPLEQVRVRPPLPQPTKLICAAVNYTEFGRRPPGPMDAFLKSPSAIIGHGDTIILPAECDASIFHHEAELGVVIGKEARNVKRADALDYVFGYTNFMDTSARGFSPLGFISFFLIKSWDTFAPMGPAITTADEIPDPQNLDVKLWNNGELRHDFNTSDMAHPVDELIEFCSRVMTLEPGDLIATGTNHQGIGAIQDGDQLVMKISGLGSLTVNVRDELKRSWPRGIDEAMAKRMRGEK